ncbi:MAG: tail fiber protein [Elusimicrobia bacterium]|nr:tail fiber protein [Elusimicrobiota bacterium]MDE2426660.1 tail fiber protein [Elusimicrobiota bacterium]
MTIGNGLTLPYSLANGTTADATQVMADLNALLAGLNRGLLDAGSGNGMNAFGSQIHNLGAGTASSDAVNLGQLGSYLPLTGGTLTGALAAGAGLTAPTMAPGDNSTNAATTAFVQAAGVSLLAVAVATAAPTGAVVLFAMSSAPSGFLACNGAAVSRSTYAALFAAIGTTFGSGDGSTTFNLPDLRGEFVRGWDNGRGIDAGRAFGSEQLDAIGSHTHSITAGGGSSGPRSYISVDTDLSDPQPKTTGATGGSETRPRNVALLYCIKT